MKLIWHETNLMGIIRLSTVIIKAAQTLKRSINQLDQQLSSLQCNHEFHLYL